MPGIAKTAYAEESAEVEVLLANTEKLKALAKKIQGSIERLDTSGRSIQAAVKPIYGNTAKLQVTNNNIDRINHAILKLRQPLDKTKKEDPIIRSGLQNTPLPAFLASMDRTNETLASLQQTNMRANQQAVEDLNNLIQTGNQALETDFRDTLKREATPVEPLQYLTKGLNFPVVSADASSRLRLIGSYMTHGGQHLKASNMYTEVRSPYITLSLQNLATATVASTKKTDSTAIYCQGTNGIGTYSRAMEALFISEHESISSVFSREQVTQIHTQTCQGALDVFTGILQELHSHIRNHIVTDCFLAYELLDIVSNLTTRLERGNSNLRPPLAEALHPIRETAKYSLQRLLEETRNRVSALMSLPADGSPVSITTDTITRLQMMTSYMVPLSTVLASFGENGWRPAAHTPSSPVPSGSTATLPTLKDFDGTSNSGNPLFAAYALDTIDTLLSNLEIKARSLLRTRSAQGVFLVNNIAVIERLIASSDLALLLTELLRPKLDSSRKKFAGWAIEIWNEPSGHLRDVTYTNRTAQRTSGGANSTSTESAAVVKAMSSKEKEDIKKKFDAFNTSFDAALVKHKQFHMEREVRSILAKEVQHLLELMYGRFWDKYHELDKGKGKHIKYDKTQLTAVLTGLA